MFGCRLSAIGCQPKVLLASACSIGPDARRVVEQEVTRTTQRVVRVSRLSNRRARVEVVVLIAARAAAAVRTSVAANARTAAAVATATMLAHAIRLAIAAVAPVVLAVTFVA